MITANTDPIAALIISFFLIFIQNLISSSPTYTSKRRNLLSQIYDDISSIEVCRESFTPPSISSHSVQVLYQLTATFPIPSFLPFLNPEESGRYNQKTV